MLRRSNWADSIDQIELNWLYWMRSDWFHQTDTTTLSGWLCHPNLEIEQIPRISRKSLSIAPSPSADCNFGRNLSFVKNCRRPAKRDHDRRPTICKISDVVDLFSGERLNYIRRRTFKLFEKLKIPTFTTERTRHCVGLKRGCTLRITWMLLEISFLRPLLWHNYFLSL